METRKLENADEVSRHFSFLNKELLEQDWTNLVKHYGSKEDGIQSSITPPLAQSTSKNQDAVAFENLQRLYNGTDIGTQGRWPTTRWKSSNTENYFLPFRRNDGSFGASRHPNYEDKMETYKLVSSDGSEKPGRPSKFCMMVMCLVALLFLIGIAATSTVFVLRPSETSAEAQVQSERTPSTMASSPNIRNMTLTPSGRTIPVQTTTQPFVKTSTIRKSETTVRLPGSKTTVPDIAIRSSLPVQSDGKTQKLDTTTLFDSKTTAQQTTTESNALTQPIAKTQFHSTTHFDAPTQPDPTKQSTITTQSDTIKTSDTTIQQLSDSALHQSSTMTQPSTTIQSNSTAKHLDTTTQSEITTQSDSTTLPSITTRQPDTTKQQPYTTQFITTSQTYSETQPDKTTKLDTTIQPKSTSRSETTKQSDSTTQQSSTSSTQRPTIQFDTTTKQPETTAQRSDKTTQPPETTTQKHEPTSQSDTTTTTLKYDTTSISNSITRPPTTTRNPDTTTRFDFTSRSESTTQPMDTAGTTSDIIGQSATTQIDKTTNSTTGIVTQFDTTTRFISTPVFDTKPQQSGRTTQNDLTSDTTSPADTTQPGSTKQTSDVTTESDTVTQSFATQQPDSSKMQSDTTIESKTSTRRSETTTQSDTTTKRSDTAIQSTTKNQQSDPTTKPITTVEQSDSTTQFPSSVKQTDSATQPETTASLPDIATTPYTTVRDSDSTTRRLTTVEQRDSTTESKTSTLPPETTTQSDSTIQSQTTVKQTDSTVLDTSTTRVRSETTNQASVTTTQSLATTKPSIPTTQTETTQLQTTTEDPRTTTSLPEYISHLSFSKSNFSLYFGEENPVIICVVKRKPAYPNLTVRITNENGLISQTNFNYGQTTTYKFSVSVDMSGNDASIKLEMQNYACSDQGIYTCTASYEGYENVSVNTELFIQVRPRLKLPNYLVEDEVSTEFSCTVEDGSAVTWSIQYNNGTLISPFEVNQAMVPSSDDLYCSLKHATFKKAFTIDMNDTTLCCNSRYGQQIDQACGKLYLLEKSYCPAEIFGYKVFPYDCFLAVFCHSRQIQVIDQCRDENKCFEEGFGCILPPPNGSGDPYSCISKPDNYYIPKKGQCTKYDVCTGQIGFEHTCPSGQYFTNDQSKPCSNDIPADSTYCT